MDTRYYGGLTVALPRPLEQHLYCYIEKKANSKYPLTTNRRDTKVKTRDNNEKIDIKL
jgi:hypothetical protein